VPLPLWLQQIERQSRDENQANAKEIMRYVNVDTRRAVASAEDPNEGNTGKGQLTGNVTRLLAPRVILLLCSI
jgi:hypothetical protein